MNGICRLCEQPCILQESHIIPKFIVSWLKDTSPTKKLRMGEIPNKRIQDGLKLHWLCLNCETKFSQWETYFAETIFYPLINGESKIHYDNKFLKFCASISWRVLKYFIEQNQTSHFSGEAETKLKRALLIWRNFIFDQERTPNEFEQHFLNFEGELSNISLPTSNNIHRYLQRTIDINVITNGKKTSLVYAKLPNFLLIGYIDMYDKNQWRETKVHVKNGTLPSKSISIPLELWEFMQKRADHSKKLKRSLSDKQKQKVKESYKELSHDEIFESETIKSLEKDIKLFGKNDIFIEDDSD